MPLTVCAGINRLFEIIHLKKQIKKERRERKMKPSTKRIISSLCLAAVLLSSLASCKPASTGGDGTTTPDTTASDVTTPGGQTSPDALAETVTVKYDSPAVCTDVGKTIDLFGCNVEFEKGIATNGTEITWSELKDSPAITDGRYVTVTEKGVFSLRATCDSKIRTIYIVSKNADENEYVLYSSDFSSLGDITKVEETSGKASVESNKLILDASSSASAYVRVLFPSYIADFAAYTVETSMKMTSAANEKRWTSIMYNVQKNNYPYYQMAIRSNAALSNGIELAEKTTANKWNVPYKASLGSALNKNTEYKLKLEVNGISAKAYVDDKLIASANDFSEHLHGRVGLQANGCRVEYSNLKIILSQDIVNIPTDNAEERYISSNLNISPSMVFEIKTSADLESILTNSPSSAIASVDSSLNILDENGNTISTVSQFIAKLSDKVIPVFRPKDLSAAESVAKYTSENLITDSFIISSDAEIIKKAREIDSKMRGILDFSESTSLDILEVRKNTNKAMASICLLPSKLADAENVAKLHALAATVWVKSDGNSLEEMVRCITSGAYGILTDNRVSLESTFSNAAFAKNTIVRPINIIGHRGMPSAAQENTIKGSILATEHGANIIENDIYLTKDGVIVVMHDSTIDRTTNGSGNIEDMTYAELSKYAVDSYAGAATEPIPTLEDYFKEFKGKNVSIFIEVKSAKPEIVTKLRELLDKYDFYSQACVITFSESQLDLVRTQIPEISCGFLSSTLSNVYSITNAVYEKVSTFNPNKSLVSKVLLRSLYARGITVWPYTLNTISDFDNYFLMGVSGVTTNYSNFAENYIRTITAKKEGYSLNAGESVDAELSVLTYAGKNAAYDNAEMVILSGNSTVKYENGKITATEKGDASVIFRISYKLASGTEVYVMSQPVTISVK